jgi:hypothetical protein
MINKIYEKLNILQEQGRKIYFIITEKELVNKKISITNVPCNNNNKIEKLSNIDTNKIMDNLIEKLANKYSNENEINLFNTGSNSEGNSLIKTKVFENLLNKLESRRNDPKIPNLVWYLLKNLGKK